MSNGAALQPGVRPREVWAWAMYDFANSGYTTVVITAVFNAYFVGVVAAGENWGTFAWTLALSISYAIVIFSAPIVGAYADAHAAKKKLLAITTSGCVLGTALLSLVGPGGDVWRFGDPEAPSVISGSAEEFCRIGAQRLAAEDSTLKAEGPDAARALRVLRNYAS